MRDDHSLQEVRAIRQKRIGFVAFLVFWFFFDDILLCAVIGSNGGWDTVVGYVLFFLLNIMIGYLGWCKWTDPKYKHLREMQRTRIG